VSLDFNFTAIRDYEELHADDDQLAVSHGLVWGALATGIGTLTEKNVPEYYARIKVLEELGTHLLQTADGPYKITIQDVRRRVGLKTNVFPEEARSKWVKRTLEASLDRHVREAARAEGVPA
jgi:hypothetical protein